jgi:hypothetical protein
MSETSSFTDETAGRGPVVSLSDVETSQDWARLFAPYSHIVLVANSDKVDAAALKDSFPADTLFVFFNKVYKVLSKPFEGQSILICRGQPKGANIVYRGEVADVLKFFPQERFAGIVNARFAAEEKLNAAADFGGAPVAHLDLVGYCNDFYTEGKVPTSGFAIALWLAEMRLPGRIVLAGFSARRSEKWRVVSVHDWSFEQTFLRLFARLGKISVYGGVGTNAYAKLTERFPEIDQSAIALAAAEVLSERLGNTDGEVDKLISLTNVLRDIDNFFRGLRPGFLRRRKK